MPRRILVGYDQSDEAAVGLQRASVLARSERAELTVVHVAVPPPTWAGLGMLAVPIVDDVVATGTLLVRRAVDELPEDLAVRWHLVSGPVAGGSFCRHRCVRRALQQTLEDGDHDLIVVGTGVAPGRIARALLRQFGDRVLPVAWTASGQAATGCSAPKMLPSVSLK